MRSQNSTPSKVEAKSGLRLVSYHDDTAFGSDDDDNDDDDSGDGGGNDDDRSTHPDDIEMDGSDREMGGLAQVNNENEAPANELKRDRFAEYGFALPAEPKAKCPQELQEKITKMYEKMRTNNMDMNKLIQERKEFRNPSIYEKLIQFCDIDELGTNYPPEIYDPAQWTSKWRPHDIDAHRNIVNHMIFRSIDCVCLHLQIRRSRSTKNWQKFKNWKWTNGKKSSIKMK